MAELAEEDREVLKDSVRRAINSGGCGKKNRKIFKKSVTKAMRKINTLPVFKQMMLEAEALELIEELWKEVVKEIKA